MSNLSTFECEACSIDAATLSDEEIAAFLPELGGWELIKENNIQKLKRTFNTKNYEATIKLTNDVAKLAEISNHHPLLVVDYSALTVIWWSHKIKGLHRNDFIMAAKTSALV